MPICRNRDYGKAIADCNQAIQANPHDSEAFMTRSLVYYRKGDKTKANEDMQRAVSIWDDREKDTEQESAWLAWSAHKGGAYRTPAPLYDF